jgi:peptide/nickel transport system substrate-binding protein
MESEQTTESTTVTNQRSFLDTLLDLSPFERLLAFILLVLVTITGIHVVHNTNESTLVEIPQSGGVHIEGIVGTPRFINPLQAISGADKDLTALVFAGLMRRDSTGTLVPLLAESYSVSEEGTVYTFTLRKDLTFHDGIPLTAADVVFTIEQAANPSIRSPLYANWDNIEVEQTDTHTVVFTLPEPYIPFLGNTTIGIVPKHLWSDLKPEEFSFSDLNMRPIGAGPYKVDQLIRDKSGIPARYELSAFKNYALKAPHISNIVVMIYDNKEQALAAFSRGTVHAVGGVSPTLLSEGLSGQRGSSATNILRTPLLITFGVFFNHNRQPVFLRDEVRKALTEATPKNAIVAEVLQGYGTVLSSPLPAHLRTETTATTTDDDTEVEVETLPMNHIEQARNTLERAGWERNEDTGIYELETRTDTLRLAISISTVNAPELVGASERIAASWRELGVDVELKVFDQLDMVQSVIRPRRFDALLYGKVLGHELDLYAFWHSSQRNDPGLNISQYADIEVDALLGNMRVEVDRTKRQELHDKFADIITDDHVAIFLYTPDYVYVVSRSVKNITLHPMAEAHERFNTVHDWYIETDRVWPFVQDLLP